MATMGLIAAMPQESNALLRLIQGRKRIALGSFSGYTFEQSKQTYTLVTSGMGVRRASDAARALIDIHGSRLLISFGIAVAVETDLRIGDVIMADSFCRLDRGVPGLLLPLAHWQQAAQEAAEKGTPFFSLRAISDGPFAPIPFDLGQMMDEDANLQPGLLLREIVRRPWIIFQFIRLMRNSRIAADNAAIALLAALSQMTF